MVGQKGRSAYMDGSTDNGTGRFASGICFMPKKGSQGDI